MKRQQVRGIVNKLLAARPWFRSGDVARETGTSRQAVHRHLRAMVEAGELVLEGRGRGARYRRRVVDPGEQVVLEREGLEEDRVWTDLRNRLPALSGLSPRVASALHYAFTEMLNNAIDHSASRTVSVHVARAGDRILFEIVDEGIGAFENVRSGLGLPSLLDAVQEMSKGKVTTMPESHTGEGIFFVSKLADRFELESDGLLWLVDNRRRDFAVKTVPDRAGTRVRFELAPETARDLVELFREYTDDARFTKTRIVVRLFEIGDRFVSRSEARRLTSGLERFETVVLDFHGVEAVGQGFADEVFRVWATAHPQITVEPVNMSEPVAFMVGRSWRGARGDAET